MIISKIHVRSNVVRIGYLENEAPAQKLKGGVA